MALPCDNVDTLCGGPTVVDCQSLTQSSSSTGVDMYAGLTRRQDKTARRRLERQAKALEKRKLALVVSGTIAEVLVAADSATTTSVIDCQSRGASVGKRERLDRVDLSNEMNDTTCVVFQSEK
eukprot:TRINITY_DN205_c0_g1_i8.p2 TRINITY_DN205_c0_g1~~TRINITY_DN205_c0_g1_i8.p2  ORF type:complete len:123 (+),score=13.56 TRINITY_DN205_c0_g1_i8:196-564(+)